MTTNRRITRLFLALFLFTSAFGTAALAQSETPESTTATRVAYFPVSVEGAYQPLPSADIDQVFLAALKASAPDLEWVPMTLDLGDVDPETAVQSALAAARDAGAELIAWGDIRFDRSSQTARGDSFNRGRLKLLITAEADIQVVRVSDQERILSQPTMVTSTDLSNAYTETGDPDTEKRLAKDSLKEAAESVVDVVRKRLSAAPSAP